MPTYNEIGDPVNAALINFLVCRNGGWKGLMEVMQRILYDEDHHALSLGIQEGLECEFNRLYGYHCGMQNEDDVNARDKLDDKTFKVLEKLAFLLDDEVYNTPDKKQEE